MACLFRGWVAVQEEFGKHRHPIHFLQPWRKVSPYPKKDRMDGRQQERRHTHTFWAKLVVA
jgi:hypothetical protein